MKTRILKLEKLEEHLACEIHRWKFQEIFGDSVEVSVERFSKPDVIEARFDYHWGADQLLILKGSKEFYRRLTEEKERLRTKYRVDFFHEVPREVRSRLGAVLWAEVYVNDVTEPAAVPVEAPQGVVDESEAQSV